MENIRKPVPIRDQVLVLTFNVGIDLPINPQITEQTGASSLQKKSLPLRKGGKGWVRITKEFPIIR